MDGLAHDWIHDIYRDPDGVMWFATDGCGVSRYDGRTFANFIARDGLTHCVVNAYDRLEETRLGFRHLAYAMINFRITFNSS